MHPSSLLLALLATATTALAAVPPSLSPTRTLAELVPAPHVRRAHPLNPIKVGLKPNALAPSIPMTNAQRLARGLNPNRPRFNRAGLPRHLAPRASAVVAAADPNPCAPVSGTILVSGAVAGTAYVSRVPNAFGEYGVTTDAADALRVQYLDCNDAATEGPTNLMTLNGIADFAFLGGITGFGSSGDSLAPGSSAYAYLGGTSQTAPAAPPQPLPNSFTFATGVSEDVESAIWFVDRSTGALTASWVNVDRSTPETEIVYYAPQDFLLITGDTSAFAAAYGSGSVVALTFVEG